MVLPSASPRDPHLPTTLPGLYPKARGSLAPPSPPFQETCSSHKAGKWKVVQESLPSKALLPEWGGEGRGCTAESDGGRDSLGVRFLLGAILGYCLLSRYYILVMLIPCANSR